MRGRAAELAKVATDFVERPDASISADQLKQLDAFFGTLAERSTSRRLRIDASRAQEAARLLTRGRSDGVLKFLATTPPARHPAERVTPPQPER